MFSVVVCSQAENERCVSEAATRKEVQHSSAQMWTAASSECVQNTAKGTIVRKMESFIAILLSPLPSASNRNLACL